MRTHVTPFVADHAKADRSLRHNAETDVVILAAGQLGERRPGTPRWGPLSSSLPRGEEAWMNAEADFEEAIREVRAGRSRSELARERRKEVVRAVAEALESARHLMVFDTPRWLFWTRREPFRLRVDDERLDVWYGEDKIELRSYESEFNIAIDGYNRESFSSNGVQTAAVARAISGTIIRYLARTAIPRRGT